MQAAFELCSSAILTAQAAQSEQLNLIAPLLLQLGFDFNFVARNYTTFQSLQAAEQQWAQDDESSDDSADPSADQTQIMLGLALIACNTGADEQCCADIFFGDGLWNPPYLLLVVCTFAAHGISTTMDEGVRNAAIQLVQAVTDRTPKQKIDDTIDQHSE